MESFTKERKDSAGNLGIRHAAKLRFGKVLERGVTSDAARATLNLSKAHHTVSYPSHHHFVMKGMTELIPPRSRGGNGSSSPLQ